MAMRPNYNQQRGDRDRAKQQKKNEKLRKREEDAVRRKSDRDPSAPPEPAAPSEGSTTEPRT